MANWQNGKMTKWHVSQMLVKKQVDKNDKMTSWWKWRVGENDKMISWQKWHDKLVKWQNDM